MHFSFDDGEDETANVMDDDMEEEDSEEEEVEICSYHFTREKFDAKGK